MELEADQAISEYARPETPLAPRIPAQSSEVAARSRSTSFSPRPSLHMLNGMPQQQREQELPKLAAAIAEPASPDIHGQGPAQKAQLHNSVSHGLRERDVPGAGSPAAQAPARAAQEEPWREPFWPPQPFPVSVQHEPSRAKADGIPSDKDCTHSALSSHEKDAATADLSGEEDHDEDDLCIVCWEQLREVVLYHCMHMCTCQGCAKDIIAAGGLCPMCRAKI
ncbi:g5680 [Coccomyxa viridis]|uniref:G5680 protein n=1 Tax=Coccomyxa viridis TaxID=1274662 RepID=A0ABP1FTH9_9CHLO